MTLKFNNIADRLFHLRAGIVPTIFVVVKLKKKVKKTRSNTAIQYFNIMGSNSSVFI
jgi:hypothetical protein